MVGPNVWVVWQRGTTEVGQVETDPIGPLLPCLEGNKGRMVPLRRKRVHRQVPVTESRCRQSRLCTVPTINSQIDGAHGAEAFDGLHVKRCTQFINHEHIVVTVQSLARGGGHLRVSLGPSSEGTRNTRPSPKKCPGVIGSLDCPLPHCCLSWHIVFLGQPRTRGHQRRKLE